MLRAFAYGFVAVLVASVAYAFSGEKVQASGAVEALVALSPGVGAFVAAWKAPRKKVLVGLLMIPATAGLTAVLNGLDVLLGGRTDFPGVGGQLALTELFLITSAVPALVGAVGGYLFAKRVKREFPGAGTDP